mmetsp:Transcript_139499/g.446331  ORF Transcript_139499/g.446331 Transcript_139499/m.446331 type:complete len:229 (-) Transcript_139499:692-1378(-)
MARPLPRAAVDVAEDDRDGGLICICIVCQVHLATPRLAHARAQEPPEVRRACCQQPAVDMQRGATGDEEGERRHRRREIHGGHRRANAEVLLEWVQPCPQQQYLVVGRLGVPDHAHREERVVARAEALEPIVAQAAYAHGLDAESLQVQPRKPPLPSVIVPIAHEQVPAVHLRMHEVTVPHVRAHTIQSSGLALATGHHYLVGAVVEPPDHRVPAGAEDAAVVAHPGT